VSVERRDRPKRRRVPRPRPTDYEDVISGLFRLRTELENLELDLRRRAGQSGVFANVRAMAEALAELKGERFPSAVVEAILTFGHKSTRPRRAAALERTLVSLAWRTVLGPGGDPYGLSAEQAIAEVNRVRELYGEPRMVARLAECEKALEARSNTSKATRVKRLYALFSRDTSARAGDSARVGLRKHGHPIDDLIRGMAPVSSAAKSISGNVSARSVETLHGRHEIPSKQGRLPARRPARSSQ
jgi:hypothetical protein